MRQRLELAIAPPIVMGIAAGLEFLAAWIDPTPTVPVSVRVLASGILIALSLAIFTRALATLHAQGTTANPHRPSNSSTLVTRGIFSVTRNPMYLAMLVLLIGLAAALSSPLALVPALLFALYVTRFQIIPEERVLTERFGGSYETYRERTRRWI